MHPLLRRQLHKTAFVPEVEDIGLASLLTAVDRAYHQADEDRRLLERSIEISSSELRQRNEALEARLQELQSTRDKLANSHSLLRSTLDSTVDAIVVVDNDLMVRAHNRQFSKLWPGEDKTALLGKSVLPLLRKFLRRAKTRPQAMKSLRAVVEHRDTKGQELIAMSDGRFLEMTSIPQLQNDVIVGRVFSLHDVTDKKHDEEVIRHQAYHDALTGLPNRLLMIDRLKHAITLATRGGRRVVLLYLDLDHFKSVNDRLGHELGDQLLQTVATRLKSRLRLSDTICRLGGDEFTITLEEVHDNHGWKAVADSLVNILAQPFEIAGHEIWVSGSIGASIFPDDAQSADELIRHADMAMYEAKQLGRNRFSEFSSILQTETDRKAAIENELRRAIDTKELFLVYQPKYELQTLKPIGFEALLRWDNRKLGFVPPDEFISVAEQCGLIVSIGDWVLNEACEQLASWRRSGHTEITMSVNLSVQQFKHRELIRDVRKALERSQLPTGCLELEITESCVMDSIEYVTGTLLTLRHFGVNLSIDDFGSGYSSMSYLKNLPVDFLKIDKTFVKDIAHSREDSAIVASMITLGHNLGLKVVAEGVEDESALEVLRTLGCDVVQGYLLSKPVSAIMATAVLEQAKVDAGQ
jgi:diguanylate cyclase (GGDEF)-like protein/PAS domain S-box-containing protein